MAARGVIQQPGLVSGRRVQRWNCLEQARVAICTLRDTLNARAATRSSVELLIWGERAVCIEMWDRVRWRRTGVVIVDAHVKPHDRYSSTGLCIRQIIIPWREVALLSICVCADVKAM